MFAGYSYGYTTDEVAPTERVSEVRETIPEVPVKQLTSVGQYFIDCRHQWAVFDNVREPLQCFSSQALAQANQHEWELRLRHAIKKASGK